MDLSCTHLPGRTAAGTCVGDTFKHGISGLMSSHVYTAIFVDSLVGAKQRSCWPALPSTRVRHRGRPSRCRLRRSVSAATRASTRSGAGTAIGCWPGAAAAFRRRPHDGLAAPAPWLGNLRRAIHVRPAHCGPDGARYGTRAMARFRRVQCPWACSTWRRWSRRRCFPRSTMCSARANAIGEIARYEAQAVVAGILEFAIHRLRRTRAARQP